MKKCIIKMMKCEFFVQSSSNAQFVIYFVIIPLIHHKNSGYTEIKVLGVWRSIILLFTAFLVCVLKG